jgi:hypothetical protein
VENACPETRKRRNACPAVWTGEKCEGENVKGENVERAILSFINAVQASVNNK